MTQPASDSQLGDSPKLPAWLRQIRDLFALDPFTFPERRRAGETVTLAAPKIDPHLFPNVTLELGEDIPARAPLEIRDDGRVYAVEGHETRELLQRELGALHLDAPAFAEHFGIAPEQMIDRAPAEVRAVAPTDPLADPSSSSALLEVAEAIAEVTADSPEGLVRMLAVHLATQLGSGRDDPDGWEAVARAALAWIETVPPHCSGCEGPPACGDYHPTDYSEGDPHR